MEKMSRSEELAREGAIKGVTLEDVASSLGVIMDILRQHNEYTDYKASGTITAAIMMIRHAHNFLYELYRIIKDKIGHLTFDLPQCTDHVYFARSDDRLPAVFDVHLVANEDYKEICQGLPIIDNDKVQGVKDQIGGALDRLEPEERQKVLIEALEATHSAVYQSSAGA